MRTIIDVKKQQNIDRFTIGFPSSKRNIGDLWICYLHGVCIASTLLAVVLVLFLFVRRAKALSVLSWYAGWTTNTNSLRLLWFMCWIGFIRHRRRKSVLGCVGFRGPVLVLYLQAAGYLFFCRIGRKISYNKTPISKYKVFSRLIHDIWNFQNNFLEIQSNYLIAMPMIKTTNFLIQKISTH